MYAYSAFGLTFHASLSLPELLPGTGAPDVTIREGALPVPPAEAFVKHRYAQANEEEALLAWRDAVVCHVQGGGAITFCRLGELADEWLPPYLLGPALGVLLHQRGLLVLHASAVEVGGGAVLFLGEKGAGKSTTAAALHGRGHRLLADDLVALDLSDPSRPMVLPGIPHQKLWPDALSALGLDPGPLPLVQPGFEKRARRMPLAAGQQVPMPLHSVCALCPGEAPVLEPLPALKAFSEVVRHVYAARFIGAAGIPPWHFQQCIALTRAVPTYRFVRRRQLEALPEALDLLETRLTAHAAALA